MRYANPFQGRINTESPAEFECDNVVARSACGRGVVLKLHKKMYHYLVDGRLVTMRAGGSRDVLEKIVAHIIDGTEPDDHSLKRCARFYHEQAETEAVAA